MEILGQRQALGNGPRFAVIGIGNVLAGDDALGPTVVRTFDAQWMVPDEVEVIDAGTPGLDLTAYIIGLDGAVFVDAVKSGGPPGTLRVFDAAALRKGAPGQALSPHQPGVREAVLHAEFIGGAAPPVRLLGVVAAQVETGIGMSDPVRAAVPALVGQVVEELAALGVTAVPRVPPREPDLWWERAA